MVVLPSDTELVMGLSREAMSAVTVSDALGPMLESLVEQTDACSALYVQADGDAFTRKASAGGLPEDMGFLSLCVYGIHGSSDVMQAIEASEGPIASADLQKSGAVGALFLPFGIRSLLATRVTGRRGELLGAVFLFRNRPGTWTSRHRSVAALLVGALSGVAARVAAEESAVSAREGAIRALGLALEYRDRETKGHTDRVTALSLAIARRLGVSESDRDRLRWGAYLHDIGKISIPDSILLKPAALTAAEREVMKTHPVVGYEFARQLGFLPADSLNVVRYHHEKWDGSGYPDGLAGTGIPLGGRIFAVADVFDALMSARPYKRAWTIQEARAEIRAQSGTSFDPDVVSAFLVADVLPQTEKAVS